MSHSSEKRIGGFGLFVLIVIGLLVWGSIASSVHHPAAKALLERAVAKVGDDPAWDHIDIDEANSNAYVLKLVYHRSGPVSLLAPVLDTQKIARSVLYELVAAGNNPSRERTFLLVWAQTPAGKGETGEPLFHIYGHAEYDADNDQIKFKLLGIR